MRMKFHLIGKDWKEDWENERCLEGIKWGKEHGLYNQYEISGDGFGIDMDFLVLTDEAVSDEQAEDLAYIAYYDMQHYEYKEFKDMKLLEEILEEYQKDGQKIAVLRTIENQVYTWIGPLS